MSTEPKRNLRRRILELIKSDLEKIEPGNGYENIFKKINIGYIPIQNVLDTPAFYLYLGSEVVTGEVEQGNGTAERRELDVHFGAYVSGNLDFDGNGNTIMEGEKVLSDLEKHFYKNTSVASKYHTSLFSIPEVRSILIQEKTSIRPLTENSGLVAMRIVLSLFVDNVSDVNSQTGV